VFQLVRQRIQLLIRLFQFPTRMQTSKYELGGERAELESADAGLAVSSFSTSSGVNSVRLTIGVFGPVPIRSI
jgi:hypothetical protein